MSTLETVAQQPKFTRLIQPRISEEAFSRLNVVAAARECSLGELISSLIMENLPAVHPTLQKQKPNR